VYGGSIINIAASGAVDGIVGCFFDRPNNWRCQVQIKVGDLSDRYDFVSSAPPDSCLSSMTLMRRGWALQERLLSPLTVHLTSTEILWEYHQRSVCETFPEELPIAFKSWTTYLAREPVSKSMRWWIVERYSSCKVTYAKEKLVAISGLMHHIQKQTGDQ
jgi:hypothetical protein